MLLWRAMAAQKALEGGSRKKDEKFYLGQLKSVEYFILSTLPITMGKMDAIMANCGAAVEIEDKSFGGK
jgi:hypothetical protein